MLRLVVAVSVLATLAVYGIVKKRVVALMHSDAKIQQLQQQLRRQPLVFASLEPLFHPQRVDNGDFRIKCEGSKKQWLMHFSHGLF
jgi:hypothetical protein